MHDFFEIFGNKLGVLIMVQANMENFFQAAFVNVYDCIALEKQKVMY